MKATTLARIERHFRKLAVLLPPKIVASLYSRGRLNFLEKLNEDIPEEIYTPPEKYSRILWGIKFRSPIMNAAGMFKNGECYETTFRQGAGAYIGGTGTWNLRRGNEKEGINLPFVPYPRSRSASNWLGLPNDGDQKNFYRVSQLRKIEGFPVVWSVMGSPDFQEDERLKFLVESMKLYEIAGVDLLELNESCPNTSHGRSQDEGLARRLKYIQDYYLYQRERNVEVVVKFSCDTKVEQVPIILDTLFKFGISGVNFGNTSIAYQRRREYIHPKERKLYDYFTRTFGGGVSGMPLKEKSLELAGSAVEYIRAGPPTQEFHVIRTGGIETLKDIQESERARISMNQWFTGYFENFAMHGHDVYKKLLEP